MAGSAVRRVPKSARLKARTATDRLRVHGAAFAIIIACGPADAASATEQSGEFPPGRLLFPGGLCAVLPLALIRHA